MTTSLGSDSESTHRAVMRVLGPVSLELDGHVLDIGRWRHGPQTVMKLLAASPGRRRSREEVIDLLWPDSTAPAGASNLRHALHLLRHAVGNAPSPVAAEGTWLVLSPAFSWWIDLEEFEQIAPIAGDDPATLEHVLSLYRGEALPENRYDDWAENIRVRTGQVWREAAIKLAMLHEKVQLLDQAAQLYERVLEADPLEETALQGLLRVLSVLGHRTQALRRYALFEQRLEAEIDVPPDGLTTELVRRLRLENAAYPGDLSAKQELSAPSPDIEPSYPFQRSGLCVGRDHEITKIVAGVFDRDSGLPRVTVVAAEAGTGKTWLLGEVARRVRQRGAQILAGGCYEQEGSLPYGPIHDALLDYVRALSDVDLRFWLRGVAGELARIVPEIADRIGPVDAMQFSDVEAQRLQLFAGVARVLGRIAEQRPLLLLLDDLHWADQSTFQLLHFLARQRELEGIAIVGTYREEELLSDSPLARFVNGTSASETRACPLRLEGLTEENFAVLLTERLDAQCSREFVHLIHERSVGNPFFALQIVRLLQQEGRLDVESGEWRVTWNEPNNQEQAAVFLPQEVRETVARRLQRLQPQTREIVTLGAVMGRQFGYPALELMWQGGEEELMRALDDALDTHVLTETEDGFVFRHPLLREVIYARLSRHSLTRLHERAGLALEDVYRSDSADSGQATDAHAAELAHHFALAVSTQTKRALHYLLLAGRHAERAFDHTESERLYQQALEVASRNEFHGADFPQLERGGILERLSDVLALQGRFNDALASLEEAVVIYECAGDRERQALVLERIGRVLWKTGKVDEGIERIASFLSREPVLDSGRPVLDSGGPVPAGAQARLLLTIALLQKMRGHYRESLAASDQALEMAAPTGDKEILFDVDLARQDALFNIGEMTAARSILENAIPHLELRGDLLRLRLALNDLGVVCWLQGDLDRSASTLSQALELAERVGDPTWIALAHTVLGHTYFFAGTWTQARAHLELGLTHVRELSESWVSAYSYACRGALEVAEGAWKAAAPLLEQAIQLAGRHSNLEVLPYPHALLAEIDIARFQHQTARDRLAPFLDSESSGITLMLPMAAHAYLQCGELERADMIAERAVLMARGRTKIALPDALRALGEVRAGQKRWPEAETALREAVAAARRVGYPYAEARALLAWGRVCKNCGNEDERARTCGQALAIFRELDAKHWITETQHAARSAP